MERVDIIVGIPSYNEADSIGFVAEKVSEGLRRYFPTLSSLIINVDNASEDGTRDSFLLSNTGSVPKMYISTERGVRGKGNNFRNLFLEVERYGPRAVAVVDGDLRSITPEWIKELIYPVLEGYDYVTPIYSRNKYDGTITNHICYPLLFSLFRTDIRQPIAGEFSFSPRLVRFWLEHEWDENIRHYGIDIFMTTTSLLNGFKVCQVILGSKAHKPSAPKLGAMFTQVITTLFNAISMFKEHWIESCEPKHAPIIGKYNYQEPQPLGLDYERLLTTSLEGFREHSELLKLIISPHGYQTLRDMYRRGDWRISPHLWAKVLFDFIIFYDRQHDRPLVVEALKPLYFARIVSFYNESKDLSSEDAERMVQNQARIFVGYRDYIIKKMTCYRRVCPFAEKIIYNLGPAVA